MAVSVVKAKKLRVFLPVPDGYNFLAMCKAYGWVKHPPFRLNLKKEILSYTHDLGTTVCRSSTSFNGRRLVVDVISGKNLDPEEKNLLTLQLRRIYSLSWNLKSFHKLISKEKEFSWIAKHRLGWFLRSGSLFEDVVKMLLTVNCGFDQAQEVIASLVNQLGKPLPPKPAYRTFPTPEIILKAGVGILRERIKSGYRSQAVAEAAHRFVKGEFSEAQLLRQSSLEARKQLMTIRGLSSDHLRQLMIFLGHFGDFPTDGIALAHPTKFVRSLIPRPQAIQAMYRKWGPWQGLVAWFDLNEGKKFPEFARN